MNYKEFYKDDYKGYEIVALTRETLYARYSVNGHGEPQDFISEDDSENFIVTSYMAYQGKTLIAEDQDYKLLCKKLDGIAKKT